MSELVTGEAVVLDIRVAKLGSRALARGIDSALQLGALIGYANLPGVRLDLAANAALSVVVFVTILVGYPVVSESLWRGKTVGKAVMGLRIVRDDGGPIRFRQALFRGLTGAVEIWLTFGFIAVITSFISHRGKRLGDMFTGTMAIGERTPARHGLPIEMPDGAQPWAKTLELAGLDNQLALIARQYLTRYEDFSPVVAAQLGQRIAALVSARVTPPPPPGYPPQVYLCAVLAERRRREALKLQPSWSLAPS